MGGLWLVVEIYDNNLCYKIIWLTINIKYSVFEINNIPVDTFISVTISATESKEHSFPGG